MSDEIKNLDESRESSSNENSPSKRVFILTSEMVKRLGLDEKIKIFKDKVKVDTSIKPVSVVQIDKDKSQLIIPKTSNEESNSDVQNKSSSNNEGSNDIKDVNSDVLPESSGNENDVEKKDKEASKKSIVHHVETLEKPLIIRRSPSKNGIVVLKSKSTGNENEKSLPKNKLKVIGDHKKVIEPSGVRKSEKLVPRKLERTVTNTGTGKINNKTKVDNDAANSSGDVIFVDAIKSNKNDSLQAFRRPTVAYRKINNRNNSKKVDESSANSNQPPGLKVIKLSTINSNASRDAILNSKDLMEHSTQELEKSLQAVSAEIEEVSSEDPNVLKNEKASLSKKKKRNPPKKKKIQVIEILDDPLLPKKRGRPRKYFTRESMAKLKSLNNGELENESNEESVSSALSQNLDGQNSNEKLEDSNSSENSTILNSKRRTRASRLLENSELLNGTKQSKTSNLNGETGNCDLNEKTKISNQNNESNDKKLVLDDSKSTEKNFESNNIKGSSKIENFSETIRHKKEEVEENAVETPVKVPVVRKGRGRPRKSVLTPSTPIAKKVVTNHVNDTVNDNADDDTNNNDKDRDEDNDDDNNNNDDNEDDDDDDDDDDNDDNDDDDDDDDDDEDYSTRSGKRKDKKSIKITTDWYIKPDGGKKSTNRGKKKKKEVKNEEAQCGKCNEKFLKSRWSAHNLSKHNNTGWLNGSKEPNFEGNEKLWKKVLGVAIKKKKGSLICDKCNEVKRSVSGFISHYKFCGKSEEEKVKMMWICPLCKGVFMPSSVDFHERTHRLEMNEAAKKPEAVTVNDDIIDGKRKRKAAEKATGKILEFTKIVRDEPPAKKSRTSKSKLDDLIEKPLSAKKLPNVWKGKWAKDIAANRPAKCRQPGCTFSTNTLDEICAHFRSCNFTPQTEYVCKICKFFSKFNDIIVSHVKSVHSDKLNSEDSDFDVNELSDGSAESDHNNCEEFNEDIDNPKNDPKFDLKKSKLKLYDKLRLLTRAQFLRNADWLPPNALNITYTPTIKWTLQFELDNYKSKLFENLLPNNFNLLTNSQAQDYLPELKVSMKTKQMKNTSQNFEFVRIKIIKEENLTEEEKRDKGWKSFKLFESAVINNVPTFFVGGPIWALAWLPIPVPMCDPEINQYLAVSTHPTMENNYTISQSYKFKNIIQIWNMGHLDHVAAATPTPKLAYMVSHNNGTIWCMEWCPSGSYHHSLLRNDGIFGIGSLKRIGLLATASSDGNVHIYSLPFPEELNFNASDNNDLPIYQTDPVVTLHLNRLLSQQNKTNWQCTSLSWSKLSGHNIIAAGFSNGYVALWDLISKSPLLVTKNLNTFHINPFQHFYVHGHSVTYVGIIPVKGKNFLATTSLDRCTKVWDLEDPYNPIDNVKKGAGTNGAWLTHWLNTYTSYDDALGLGHTVSYMMAVRDSSSIAFPLLPTNSTTYGLAVSDYANGICHGTLAGDITAIFPFQMFYMKDIDKLTKKRWLVSSIELVDFGENTEGENDLKANGNNDEQTNDCKNILETYDACKDRFGIVYHDDLINYKTNLLRKINRRNPVNSETMNTVPLEQYQFTSVNRLAWNQNSWSYLWVAAGYQNGLIRIFNLKSMSVHNAVDKLLPDHTKSMMHKFNNEQS